ncbi:LuxR C-terminal-related transcriptional regulator [Gordonia defluvii]|uniref:LuxR C-terminal-related transcriptional regulator n=1 Tax=Gordonia defluvii TaxID=283718 RepID=UPI0031E2B6A5
MAPRWPLVGRASEVARLCSGLDEGVRTVLVSGPAGIGKTRLAHEVTHELPNVRWVRGSVSATTVPLGAYAEFVRADPVDPVLRIGQLIAALSSPPSDSVVVIDDIQYLDPLSILVTRALAVSEAVRVVLTWRTGEALTPELAELLRVDGLPRVELAPLSRTAIDELARGVLGDDLTDRTGSEVQRLTEGNPLFLTALLADPVVAGRRLTGCARTLPPTLLDVIESRLTALPAGVRGVLDLVALGEPVPVAAITSLTSTAALERAEAADVVLVDDRRRQSQGCCADVRLTHPLYGEARLNTMPESQQRRLRAQLVDALGGIDAPDVQAKVKRAVLASRADPSPHSDQALVAGAVAAMGLAALPLAVELAALVGPGEYLATAQLTAAHAMTVLGDADGAQAMYARISVADLTAPQWESLLVLEAYTQLWTRNDAAGAARIVTRARAADAGTAALAAEGMLLTAAGRPVDALRVIEEFHASAPGSEQARITVGWAELTALSEVGRIADVEQRVRSSAALAESSALIAYWRLTLTFPHLRAQKLAGSPERVRQIWEAVQTQVPAQPGAVMGWLTGFAGVTASARGDLRAAGATLDAALAIFGEAGAGPEMWFGFALERAEVAAQTNDGALLNSLLERLSVGEHDGYGSMLPVWQAVAAWVDANDGALSAAIAQVLEAARVARTAGQSAYEVLCLQTAARFGSTEVAPRLAELAVELPDMPRARLAAVHAAALAAGDGAALVASSEEYEHYGLLLGAVDAAAQAATAYRAERRAGSAMTATDRMRVLADQTGANTPAMAAVIADDGLTDRQREIVRLAAIGLSNKEIAERLVVSVRTVEGHVYRASQILGAPVRGTQPPAAPRFTSP